MSDKLKRIEAVIGQARNLDITLIAAINQISDILET